MDIKPIIAALRRNKTGAILIALQIALALAIVCNALFIIHQRLAYMGRDTGIDEPDIFVMSNLYVGRNADDMFKDEIAADLQALRSLPGVVDATRSNSYPLRGGGWGENLRTSKEPDARSSMAALYISDDHLLPTFGLKLVAGRNFSPAEIGEMSGRTQPLAPVVILTQDLADALFPDGQAIGKTLYISDSMPASTVIGIVEHLQSPWVGSSWADTNARKVVIVPTMDMGRYGHFIVRTEPGMVDQLMKSAEKRLIEVHPRRVLYRQRSYAEVRAVAYRRDRGMAILMSAVCVVLLIVTAAGIVGLANFWVGQRQRHIGIRRALGARSRDILHYFQMENLLISCTGVVLGAAGAVGLNLWLATHYEMSRISLLWLLIGAVLLLLLGQGAVLQPARRASRVPPVVATRGA